MYIPILFCKNILYICYTIKYFLVDYVTKLLQQHGSWSFTNTIMATHGENAISQLTLDDPEETKLWLMIFEATCSGNKIKDENKNGTQVMTNKFIEKCGIKALRKITSLLPNTKITELPYEDIKNAIQKYMEPTKKLIIAERTNFFMLHQSHSESVGDYLARLNKASESCEFEKLKQGDPTNEIIKLRLIAGINDQDLKRKIMDKLNIVAVSYTHLTLPTIYSV